ncbi:MAG: redoxin domain-containing protein [Bacteroidales bacterium]|nr:redoxin domain-containing protein [Bacteroidales bacterium]
MKRILFIAFLLSLFQFASAQDGYQITLQIKGINDTISYLAYYKGDQLFVQDTAYNNTGDGSFTFEADSLIPQGMYIFAGQRSNKYFDFLLDDHQQFSIISDTDDVIGNMKIKNSKANQLFFDYVSFISNKQKEIKSLKIEFDSLKGSPKAVEIQSTINSINKMVEDHRSRLIENYSDNYTSAFLKATLEPKLPDFANENGVYDSLALYRYYKHHYWDNAPLRDNRLFRTPYFQKKLDQYLDKVVIQHPDTLIAAIDSLLVWSKPAKDIFQHIMWNTTIKYENSKIMGFDKIFVHLAQTYYAQGFCDWMYPQVVTNIVKRGEELAPLLLDKVAPNLILLDTSDHIHEIHAVDAKYTLLYFWSTDCGHCKKETPKMVEFYKQFKDHYNLEVFGINTDTSMSQWREFIVDYKMEWINTSGYRSLKGDFHKLYDIYSTPTIFLLDENKKIIAKRVLTDQIKELIRRREEIE